MFRCDFELTISEGDEHATLHNEGVLPFKPDAGQVFMIGDYHGGEVFRIDSAIYCLKDGKFYVQCSAAAYFDDGSFADWVAKLIETEGWRREVPQADEAELVAS